MVWPCASMCQCRKRRVRAHCRGGGASREMTRESRSSSDLSAMSSKLVFYSAAPSPAHLRQFQQRVGNHHRRLCARHLARRSLGHSLLQLGI
jgi:hypothetical protein